MERRRQLSTRVLASFAVVVVAFAATIATGLLSQRRAARDVAALSLGYVPLETALASARSTEWTVAARLDRLLEDPSAAGTTREWLETVARGRPAVLAQARDVAANVLGQAADEETAAFGRDVATEIEAVDRELQDVDRALADVFAAIRAGDVPHARDLLRVVSARERSAAQGLDALAARIGNNRESLAKNAVARDRRSIAVSIALAVVSLFVAGFATRDVRRRLAPLARLTGRAQAIAAGDRSPLPRDLLQDEGAPRDEIGELAAAFAAMVEGVATRDADLLRLRRRQEDIVDHLRAAVIAVGEGGHVEAANPAARTMFSIALGDTLPRSAPRLWEVVEADVDRALTGVDPAPRIAVTIVTAPVAPRDCPPGAGEARVVDLRVVPMRTEEADRRLALLVADDVSEAAAARQRALQAERLAAIGKMAAHITHEIRNPLSSIGLNVELLDETLAKGASGLSLQEARRLLAAIAREVGRLSDVSEEYLRVARLPSPRPQAVDLGELVRDVVGFSRPELERARIVVDMKSPGNPVVAAIDEAQVRQALLNLVRNAREAMEDGGKLCIELVADDRTATLHVADEGKGIDESLRSRIFDPFFTTKATGTGLGLPLTKQILEAHGGAIAYAPVAPHGSRFTLTFPRTAAKESRGETKDEGASGGAAAMDGPLQPS